MTTARDIIKGGMRSSTVLRRGMTAGAEDMQEGLEALNQMLDMLSSKNIVIPYRTRESFTPASSKSSYSIGSAGDFNTTRPVKIENITVTAGGSDYIVNQYDLANYNSLRVKNTVGIPDNYYYNPVYPLGLIYFDYQPSTSYTIIIDSLKALTRFAGLTTTLSLPEGYEEMLKMNLATRLCVEAGRQVPQYLHKLAEDSLNAILTQNLVQRMNTLKVDGALLRTGNNYNILRGT